MTNVYDILVDRGYVEQCTDMSLVELLEKESVKFYIGFDPTADSLHVGHFIQIMVMMHMQQAGHTPIALFGGGTGMVGDPSGKNDMRKMMTVETIAHNIQSFKTQMSKYIDFNEETPNHAIMVNNGDWLLDLNYIEFLREVGVHFSVNRMLAAECFKSRLGDGLTFFEFNYMLMQSYDFLRLQRSHDCKLQLGGNDQWSNIIGGVELNRRADSVQTYGLTFKLLTNSQGKKMGKTESGALWLDPEKTSPYEFYQYWRNVDDADVEKCLALLTFLPMDEVRTLGAAKDAEINKSKEVLAYEVTKLIHGEAEADKAVAATKALFGGGGDLENMPTTEISAEEFADGLGLIAILVKTGLTGSNSDARRLIKDGGVQIEGVKITDFAHTVKTEDFVDGKLLIKKGKKVYHKIVLA